MRIASRYCRPLVGTPVARFASPADFALVCSHSACHTDTLRAADATPTPLRSQNCQVSSIKKISACLNSVASVNPAVLIDRAERGLRKMVKDETHDRLTSTVSFWSSIGFYSLCSSSMLLGGVSVSLLTKRTACCMALMWIRCGSGSAQPIRH